MLSHIIAGKTKQLKDPFSGLIHAEASHSAGYRQFNGFWEKWGNTRYNRKEQKVMEPEGDAPSGTPGHSVS